MSSKAGGWLRMQVAGVHLEPDTDSAVLLLQTAENRNLPILIGLAEATSIAKDLEGIELPRPITHDLMRDLLTELGARVVRVEITDLRENTYYAQLVLMDRDGTEMQLDSRPSDAVALALRVDAPIFAHEQVLAKTYGGPQEILAATEKEDWKKVLEEMDPEDFGKYKM